MKVLIVDDNTAVQGIIRDILAEEGHIVRVASTIDEAVEKVSSFVPDVILLDTKVGDQDGMRLLSLLHEGSYENLNVILVKDRMEQVPKDDPYIKGHVDKPFKSTDILEALKDIAYVSMDKPEEHSRKWPGLFSRKHHGETAVTTTPSEKGVQFGTSYVIFEQSPQEIYAFLKMFNSSGYNIMVITSNRSKAITSMFDHDNIEVLSLAPSIRGGTLDIHALGSLMVRVSSFVESCDRPVVAFDNIGELVESNGMNSVLMMIHQLVGRNDRDTTMVVSVDGSVLTDKDRDILLHDLKRYEPRQ